MGTKRMMRALHLPSTFVQTAFVPCTCHYLGSHPVELGWEGTQLKAAKSSSRLFGTGPRTTSFQSSSELASFPRHDLFLFLYLSSNFVLKSRQGRANVIVTSITTVITAPIVNGPARGTVQTLSPSFGAFVLVLAGTPAVSLVRRHSGGGTG